MRTLYTVVLFFFLCSSTLPAQWVRDMNNFEGGIIECLSSSGDTVVAGTRGGGVYVSTDGGQNWLSRSVGLAVRNVISVSIGDMGLFAATYYDGGFYHSSNLGLSWESCSNGIDGQWWIFQVVQFKKSCIAASGNGLIWSSEDGGKSWTQRLSLGQANEFRSVAIIDSTIYVVVPAFGLYASTDAGKSWKLMSNASESAKNARVCAAYAKSVYIATSTGELFSSADSGQSWTRRSDVFKGQTVLCMHADGTMLYLGTLNSGLYQSSDAGATWKPCSDAFSTTGFQSISSTPQYIIAGGFSGISRSVVGSEKWAASNKGLIQNMAMWGAATQEDYLYVCSSANGVFRRAKGDSVWNAMNSGIKNVEAYAIACDSKYVALGTDSGGVFISTNHGTSWIDRSLARENGLIEAAGVKDSLIIIAPTHGDVFVCSGINDSLRKVPVGDKSPIIYHIATASARAYLAADKTLYAMDYGTQAVTELSGVLKPIEVCVSISASDKLVCAATAIGVYVSSDNGAQWEYFGVTDDQNQITCVTCLNETILVGTTQGDIFVSTDKGLNWTNEGSQISSQPEFPATYNGIAAISAFDGQLFAVSTRSSVLHRPLDQIVDVDDSKDEFATNTKCLLSCSPNPSSDKLQLAYSLSNSEVVKLKVHSIHGELVEQILQEPQSSGSHFVLVDVSKYPNGVYLLTIETPTRHESRCVTISR